MRVPKIQSMKCLEELLIKVLQSRASHSKNLTQVRLTLGRFSFYYLVLARARNLIDHKLVRICLTLSQFSMKKTAIQSWKNRNQKKLNLQETINHYREKIKVKNLQITNQLNQKRSMS